MKSMRRCEKCFTDKWIDNFREYAPGKHRYTCRACENEKQKVYQRRYDQKKREQERLDKLALKDNAIVALTAEVETLKQQVARLLEAAGLANR